MQDLCSISLCAILARTISKAISKQLETVMDKVISPRQSDFIKGRSIVVNIIVAHELDHFMRSCNSSKSS